MTREKAIATAHGEARILATAVAVYRFPAWPAGVYGVRRVELLPGDAERFEVFGALVVVPAAAGQGSLF